MYYLSFCTRIFQRFQTLILATGQAKDDFTAETELVFEPIQPHIQNSDAFPLFLSF